ncbi:DNA starvation/stationary phase protection protein [Nocardioides sp. J2M5]|uniref:Dps family protein n=1 Tax=Nocardioides palaemonis TaxID=2829810 RepID=UPI001BAA7A96|nr:DNA starvation/stationary phase protection protein [Nocardioides palaemonis]MBS2939974.1 DNA starvation/stationary phase protection protein [Nocardioides palaemonis]
MTTHSTDTTVTSGSDAPLTVPGLSPSTGHAVADALQMRVHALNDLQLTLKHAHWNVVGPHFIGVHEMLDPQIDGVRDMVDVLAERMSTLGVPPNGLPGALVSARTWDDYSLDRADTAAHLAALDLVYTGVIEDHRAAIAAVGDDPVTEDILIGQTADLEQYQWFVRAHLQGTSGALVSGGAGDEVAVAEATVDAKAPAQR